MSKQVIQLDPRQALVAKYYRDPNSATFANLKGSMIRAGYSEGYADNNYDRGLKWIEHVKDTVAIIKGAERNLKKYIEKEIDIDAPLTKTDIELLKIQQKSTEFSLKTLAGSKYNDNQDKQDAPSINVNIIKQYNITNQAPSDQSAPSEPYPDAEPIDPLTQ